MNKRVVWRNTNYQRYKSALILDDLGLKLHLGVTKSERTKEQTVLVTAKISFLKLPKAARTGKITDAICYDALVQKIKKFCCNKEFTLIENLGMQLFLLLKKNIFKNCKLYLRVTKLCPLPDLPRSIFEISD
ncbi:MAG: dihydroneopterin aldolase [Coxiellaceae bacterium]|jgi:FolB domain-containing protein|nr:dihydroneopterin aldolase [Coxiellaceae bacterium]